MITLTSLIVIYILKGEKEKCVTLMKRISFRVTERTKEELEQLVAQGLFKDISHAVRSAIELLLIEHSRLLKEK